MKLRLQIMARYEVIVFLHDTSNVVCFFFILNILYTIIESQILLCNLLRSALYVVHRTPYNFSLVVFAYPNILFVVWFCMLKYCMYKFIPINS